MHRTLLRWAYAGVAVAAHLGCGPRGGPAPKPATSTSPEPRPAAAVPEAAAQAVVERGCIVSHASLEDLANDPRCEVDPSGPVAVSPALELVPTTETLTATAGGSVLAPVTINNASDQPVSVEITVADGAIKLRAAASGANGSFTTDGVFSTAKPLRARSLRLRALFPARASVSATAVFGTLARTGRMIRGACKRGESGVFYMRVDHEELVARPRGRYKVTLESDFTSAAGKSFELTLR